MGRDRINGPYKHRKRWRCIETAADGTESVVSFATREEALAYKAAAEKTQIGRRLGDAVRDYVEHLRSTPAAGGHPRRESTLRLLQWHLCGLLRLPDGDMPLAMLNRGEMRRLFEQRAGEVATDTLIGELRDVKRWAKHWVEAGDLTADPTVGLLVHGERSAGKPQLRMDEARRFLGSALADESPAGTACALALLSGCRASEITGLVVHDLDDNGRVLWVADNMVRRLKTRKQRQLEVPTLLQDRLRALAAGRAQHEQLFGDVDRHWLGRNVTRLCKVAGVPVVSPHGLRGTWASLARGVMPTEQVAATIGNLPQVSATSYIAPGAAASADARRLAGTLIEGGHRGQAEVDDRDRGGRDVGGGRVRHDGPPGSGHAGVTPVLGVRARAGGTSADGPRPGDDRPAPGVQVSRGPAPADSQSRVTVPVESLPTSTSLDEQLLN